MAYFFLIVIVLAIFFSLIGNVDANEQISTPEQQMDKRISSDKIICSEGLELIFKIKNNSPACVKASSVDKLVDRGWGVLLPSVQKAELNSTNIVETNNQFAIDFYSQIKDNDENIFYSPLSISTAFAIAYEGARDDTAQEIRQVFQFTDDEQKRRNSFSDILRTFNETNNDYKLRIANALWINENYDLIQNFVDNAKAYYDSDVNNVNFVTNEGVERINEWVKSKTEEKINQLFEPGSTDESTRLIITNAIYFKGSWDNPFDESQTRESDFRIDENTVVKAEFMHLSATDLNYTETDNLEIIELPYNDDKFSMLILLPKAVDGLKSLEESFSPEKLQQWEMNLNKTSISVLMPKFKLETNYDLTKPLQKMGMNISFDSDKANFSGISETEKLFIQTAIHKTFVEVNEEGTEAGAATGIKMRVAFAPPEFTANHPFIFIIQENETGNILFIGRLIDPTE